MDQYTSLGSGPNPAEGEFWAQFSEEWQEILAAYALGALEPDEMIALDDYLQHHPELHGVVDRLGETAAGLAYSAPAAAPSSAAKGALMDRVYADLNRNAAYPQRNRSAFQDPAVGAPTPGNEVTRRTLSSGAPREVTPPSGASLSGASLSGIGQSTAITPNQVNEPLHPAPRPPIAKPARRLPPRGRSSPRASAGGFFDFATGWKVATMATAAALLFFVIATTQLTGQLSRVNERHSMAEATIASLQEQLNNAAAEAATWRQEATLLQSENSQLQNTAAQLSAQLQVDQQQLVSLLNVSQVVELGGTEFAPNAQGALFVGQNSLVLILQGLQPLPSGEIYQLWLIPADESPISAGLVQVRAEDAPSFTTDVTLATTSFAAVGLSVEPAGGSEQPTGNIVMLGNRT